MSLIASPYIIANKLKNAADGVLNLSDFQNNHIPRNQNPIMTGMMPIRIFSIIGAAFLIVFGAL
jgi:hypothetical protein